MTATYERVRDIALGWPVALPEGYVCASCYERDVRGEGLCMACGGVMPAHEGEPCPACAARRSAEARP